MSQKRSFIEGKNKITFGLTLHKEYKLRIIEKNLQKNDSGVANMRINSKPF
jgi:hypothetical protein